MIFKQEQAPQAWGRMLDLLFAHGREVVGPSFNLDISRFTNLANAGLIKLFVMCPDDSDSIVGYTQFVLGADPLRCTDVIADCTAIYVRPEFRGHNSAKLIRYSEVMLASYGVKRIHVHGYEGSPLAKMYSRLGYSSLEVTLKKDL